jgi:tol-pal system protein YbgF
MSIKNLFLCFFILIFCPYLVHASNLEDRISRLENIIANQNQQLAQLDNMQTQIQELRGNIELLTNENSQLKQQQITYFTDLDQRLQEQEKQVSRSPSLGKDTAKVNSATASVPVMDPKKTGEVALLPLSAAPLAAGTSPPAENDNVPYDAAFNLLKEKKYPEAIKQFKTFLTAYPESRYVPNAHYWLGELYLAQAQTPEAKEEAEKEFTLLINQYPQHPKVPDALLKMALIKSEQGDSKVAIDTFKKIVTTYPGTSAANLAQAKLDSLKK